MRHANVRTGFWIAVAGDTMKRQLTGPVAGATHGSFSIRMVTPAAGEVGDGELGDDGELGIDGSVPLPHAVNGRDDR